jgi:hypothetical protein
MGPQTAHFSHLLGVRVLGFVLASRRTPPPFCRRHCSCHPERRAAATLAPSPGKPFEDDNCFLYLLAFLA